MTNYANEIERLMEIMDRLLGPQGCPWDREQTHESLIRYLIEESYEVIDAIQAGEMNKLQEELGDLLLQVVFHAALAEREGFFNLEDVIKTVSSKMIDRHPHVFSSMKLGTSDDVMEHWETFKRRNEKKTVLEGIPKMLPALMRAEKLQEKAARVGFDWPQVDGAIEKFKEEVEEFKMAPNSEQQVEEMGDILFSLVNIGRMKKIEMEQTLQAANDKFTRRFNYIEERIAANGKTFEEMELREMDVFWDEAKAKGL